MHQFRRDAVSPLHRLFLQGRNSWCVSSQALLFNCNVLLYLMMMIVVAITFTASLRLNRLMRISREHCCKRVTEFCLKSVKSIRYDNKPSLRLQVQRGGSHMHLPHFVDQLLSRYTWCHCLRISDPVSRVNIGRRVYNQTHTALRNPFVIYQTVNSGPRQKNPLVDTSQVIEVCKIKLT